MAVIKAAAELFFFMVCLYLLREINVKKILIVEDEIIIAMGYVHALQNASFSIADIFDTGEEAVKSIQSIYPDLILMDINLKGKIDGIETARQILEILYIPIIFISGNNDTKTKEMALSIHSAGYFNKPINLNLMIAKIRKILNS